jgi:glycosyltransferase involved in cell wall biosynthesis
VSRVLVLLPSVPDPPDAGAKLRNLGLLRLLGQAHEVDAIAFGESDALQRLAPLVRHASVVQPPPRTRARRAVDLFTAHLPDMALRLWSDEFAHTVRTALHSREYTAVQAEGIEMAPYLALVRPEHRVYDAHNAEFLLQARAAHAAGSLVARGYSRIQSGRLERFEREIVATSRVTLAVSEHDANQLLALANGDACVHVVPNAIDVRAYAFAEPMHRQANMLLLGKLDFRPNADGARWLLRRVMPELFAAVPGARLFAVGGAPPRWLVRRGQRDTRVAVTGYVVDERPYLARSAALLLPLRIAAGTRLKALVAMASGVPIVSTRLGMEGLAAVDGEHFLRADSAAEWVDALRRVLCDAALRQKLAEQAHALVAHEYDWAAIEPALRRAYAELAR